MHLEPTDMAPCERTAGSAVFDSGARFHSRTGQASSHEPGRVRRRRTIHLVARFASTGLIELAGAVHRFSAMLFCFIAIGITGCADISPHGPDTHRDDGTLRLFDATMALEENWQHLPLRGKTEYRLAVGDDNVAIRAEGKNSASGLIRRIDVDTHRCHTLEWRWRVDELQESADLRDKKREDVAASIFLLFGDPGFMTNPDPVPTLRYVWTNSRHSRDDVVDNPYLPGVVRSIVIRAGERGRWYTESRNVEEDYARAFGQAPADQIHAIAIFTDNDQTHEQVTAYYRWARVRCSP
jgi:Protein of unknown function (DUF3047)